MFAPTVLADGQIPASKTAVYTVPTSTKTIVKQFRIYSTTAITQEITVYLNVSGTSRAFAHFVLTEDEFADVLSGDLQLEADDAIEAETTTASVVDYVLTGEENSI